MPKRILGFASMVPEVSEPDLDFSELEKIMQIKLGKRQRNKILKTLNYYLSDSEYYKKAPKAKEVREQAEEINKHALKLSRLLGDSTEKGQVAMGESWPWEYNISPESIIDLLRNIALKSKKLALDLGEDKPGRPPNIFLAPFIAVIGNIYDNSGGQFPGISSNHSNNTTKGHLYEGMCWLLDKCRWDNQSKGRGDYPQNAIAREITRWRKQSDNERYTKPMNWNYY